MFPATNAAGRLMVLTYFLISSGCRTLHNIDTPLLHVIMPLAAGAYQLRFAVRPDMIFDKSRNISFY